MGYLSLGTVAWGNLRLRPRLRFVVPVETNRRERDGRILE
jgi:hypothetical protein